MLAYRASNWLADAFTNVSREAVIAFEKGGAVRPGDMPVLYNGFDLDRFQPDAKAASIFREESGLEPSDLLIATAGSLRSNKNHSGLIDALKSVLGHRSDWLCVIAGEVRSKSSLARQIDEVGLTGRVKLIGARADIPRIFAAADLFVLSSFREGFPLVIGEAMASGLPVVATNCGGVAEFVGTASQQLVPKGSTTELANGISNAIRMSPDARRQIGASNRQRIEAQFSLEAVTTSSDRAV